jgi:hypothetical protein
MTLLNKFCSIVMTALLMTFCTYAQNYFIKGHVVSGKAYIDFANIVLQKTDSSFVDGCIADKSGFFRLNNITAGNYLLRISNMGYETRIIPLTGLSKDKDLGTIQLDSASVTLKEVTITATHIINTPEKKIVLPSAYQIKASTNGLELLQQMHLNRLQINTVQNTISSTMPGEVQFRINGVKADMHQVRAIRPEDIMRVEYHDDPSMRYGENVAAVIDYITKRPTHGGYIGLDLNNSPFTLFGNNTLSAKYNHNKSEVGINIFSRYRDLNGYWRKNSETFNFDNGTSFTRKEDGIPSRIVEDEYPVSIYYNYQEGKKWFFNASFYINYSLSKMNTKSKLYPETEPDNYVDMKDFTKEHSNSPYMDLYFQRNFDNHQYFILDVVGTYIHTNNERDYNENKNNLTLEDIYSKVYGNKYSIIGEAIYGKQFDKLFSLNVGTNYYQAYTKNEYSGTVAAISEMRENHTTGFVEIKGAGQRFNYSLAGRFSHYWIQQGDNSYHKNVVYPKLKLGYHFSDKLNLSYSGGLTYNTPSLSNLSNVSQLIDSLQIRRGNPNLKVSYAWSHYLNSDWQSGMFDINASIFYMYQGKPVMEETLRENNKFIRTTFNQKSWQKLNPEINIQFGPIHQILTLGFQGGVNYFDSKGLNYHHHYTNWYCSGSLTASYKNFIMTGEIRSHCNDFYGETLNYGENYHVLSLKYKYKDMSFGVTALNPFVGRNSYNRPSENWSHYAPSHNTWYLRESSHLFIATFSWNINFGRRYNASSKQINNADTDSGTLKSTK